MLTAGVRTPPARLSAVVVAVALSVLAVAWLPLGRYVALPEISVRRFEVAGRETVVVRVRARDLREGREPVFCVAGWSGDPTEPWSDTFRALTRQSGRELIAIALPELSAGAGSLEARRKIPQLVKFLRAAIEQLSPQEPVLLMGSSLGGLVTLTLAQDPRAPIVGWVTVGSMGFEMPALLKVATHRAFAAPVGWLGLLLPPSVRRLLATLIRTRFNPDVTEAAIQELHMEISDRKELERVLAHGPRFLTEANRAIDPGAIRFHGLAIWGELDTVSPAHNAAWFKRRRPDLEVVVFDGGPHSLQMASPERFARLVVGSRAFALTRRASGRPDPVGGERQQG
jgi:pimeloyl-ACP methyl ester carboxylesterase